MTNIQDHTDTWDPVPAELRQASAVLPNGHQPMADVIKVSAKSRATAVAGAIAGVVRDHGTAEVQAIGAGAVNQAVKAIAIARAYLQRDSLDIAMTPTFTDVAIDGQERTAVRFTVRGVAQQAS